MKLWSRKICCWSLEISQLEDIVFLRKGDEANSLESLSVLLNSNKFAGGNNTRVIKMYFTVGRIESDKQAE